ncbi:MAG: hypothetical protein DRO11_06800, partial [Methanobacteriota archaeon]
MIKMRIVVTHKNLDFDAASCLWFLERGERIDEIIFYGKDFGVGDFEKIREGREIGEIIFVDFSPS